MHGGLVLSGELRSHSTAAVFSNKPAIDSDFEKKNARDSVGTDPDIFHDIVQPGMSVVSRISSLLRTDACRSHATHQKVINNLTEPFVIESNICDIDNDRLADTTWKFGCASREWPGITCMPQQVFLRGKVRILFCLKINQDHLHILGEARVIFSYLANGTSPADEDMSLKAIRRASWRNLDGDLDGPKVDRKVRQRLIIYPPLAH